NASEKSGSAILDNFATRTENSGGRRYSLTDADEIVFVSTGAVKNEQRLPRCRICRRNKAVDETEVFSHALGPRSSRGMRMLGSRASISNRLGSSQSGSLSVCLESAIGYITANPGPSVAISNRTPPGS